MTVWRTWIFVACMAVLVLAANVFTADAVNIGQYSDTLSNSAPSEFSNHTFRFRPTVSIGPGAHFEFDFPADFAVTVSTTTFTQRNVQLFVNGVSRTVATSSGFGVDEVAISGGAGGSVRYTLGSDITIPPNSSLELRVGNHTIGSLGEQFEFSSTTGTTTIPADIKPIQNSGTLGVHEIDLEIVDGGVIADTRFVIFLNPKVAVGPVDTTETVPPERFNGAPTSTVGGTTLNVEISLETNELAICRFDTVASTTYALQPNTFSNTGFLYHTTIVAVTPGTVASFFVRCIDDEGNFNIDDYLIEFTVNDTPTGTANEEGDNSGDGTGSGNTGGGSGAGGGGTTGSASGQEPATGGSSGSGGSGGGGGGGRGSDSDNEAGGGFESTDGPFESGDGQVTISGFAFPNARVVILVDGQIALRVNANGTGAYTAVIDGIARGAYTFGVYAEDRDDERSSTFSTSFTVSGARASRLSNINIPPSIIVAPDPAEPGETVVISGYALPNATVNISTSRANGANAVAYTAVSDSNGRWQTSVDTTGFARATYRVRASAEQLDGRKTGFSEYEFFGIGQAADRPLSPDLNRDGSVNLTDFSILLFWWQTSGGDSNPPADINQDGNVSLTDFSILLFNWTG